MPDFYARNTSAAPLPRAQRAPRAPQAPRALQDQADGLRRMFAVRRRVVLPLAANPHGASSPRVLDRLAAVLASQGHHVLVVDAGDAAGSARMLAAALAEYPDAQVLVLPCPDVPGQRRTLADAARVRVLAAGPSECLVSGDSDGNMCVWALSRYAVANGVSRKAQNGRA